MAYQKQWAVSSSVKRSIAKRLAVKAKESQAHKLAEKVEKVMEDNRRSFRFRLGALLACDGRRGYWFN